MLTSIKTTDIELGAKLLSKGATLAAPTPWKVVKQGRRRLLEFNLEKANTDDIEDYKSGRDGLRQFMGARGSLLNIISTEIGDRANESNGQQELTKAVEASQG